MIDPDFTRIADAAVELLKTAGVADGRVHHVIPPESFFSIGGVVVTMETATPSRPAMRGHPVDWNSVLRIDCSHRFGVNNERPHEGCTRLAGEVALALFGDESLGGLIDGLLPGPIAWDYRDPEKQLAVCTMHMTVMHRTNYGAL